MVEIHTAYSLGAPLGNWLLAGSYDLIVVSRVRPSHERGVKALLDAATDVGVPVLLVPGASWGLTSDWGLRTKDVAFTNFTTVVAEHEAAEDVYTVGVKRCGAWCFRSSWRFSCRREGSECPGGCHCPLLVRRGFLR